MTQVLDQDANMTVRTYKCRLCHDSQRLTVPYEGEKWDTESLYIEGACCSILCPDCMVNDEAYQLRSDRDDYNRRLRKYRHTPPRAIDREYIQHMRLFRENRLSSGARAELKGKMEAAKAKFLGHMRENSRRLKLHVVSPEEYEEAARRDTAAAGKDEG